MMKTIFRLFLPLLLAAAAYAAPTGEFSLFVLKEGKALGGSEVLIDKTNSYVTDSDGYLFTKLEAGKHQIEVVTRENGRPLAFVKKTILIQEGKQSQMIISLKADDTLGFSDVEAPEGIGAAEANATAKTAAKGSISVQLLSAEEGKAIENARIYVKGLPVEAKSDAKGRFVLELPAGEQTLSVIHSDYSAQTVKVTVVANEVTNKVVEMTPASMELEEFVVLAPHIEGSVSAAFDERKNDTGVTEVLSAEQFSKQGDSSAAGALKRASGLTLVGGKYVYIRGLGDRYSSSQLNGLHLPSPEPTKRVVPLDMFPTGVIESIKIQKTYEADLPANFGGGNIDIRTKNTPDEFFMKFSAAVKYTEGTTFNKVNSYHGGDLDWTGYDTVRDISDETKAKTDNFANPISSSDVQVKGDLTKNPAEFTSVTALPGFKAAASLGDSYTFSNGMELGYIASYSYSNDWDSYDQERSRIGISDGEVIPPTRYQQYSVSDHEIKHGGILGFALDINEDHKIKQSNLYIHHTNDVTTYYDGTNEDSDAIHRYLLSWVERSLFISQLEGMHAFDYLGDLRFNWAVEYGKASRSEPATKEYTYLQETDGVFRLTPKDSLNYTNGELDDSLLNGKASLQYPFYLTSDFDLESTVEIGAEQLSKERESKTRRYGLKLIRSHYTDEERAGSVDGVFNEVRADDYRLGTTFKPPEFYTAEHTISAFYLRSVLKPWSIFDMTLGARVEQSHQQVDSYDVNGNPVSYVLDGDDILPELTATLHITDEMLVRAGYSQSVSRPDFREFAPTRYQDPVTGDIVIGNADLTYTHISSYDLSWEWYFSALENISVGVFYKEFEKPIESIKNNLDTPTFSFVNADTGMLYGVELGFRKNLDFYQDWFESFFIAGNFALIQSNVKLDDATVSANGLTTQEREMQGQSPYVVNVQIGYDDSDKRSAILSYNVIGERIVALGTEGYPDTYEEPVNLLDFVWIEKIGDDLKLKFKALNIVDESVRWTQAGYDVRRHKKGRKFELGMDYAF
jgi:TonB-dependent receptor